MQFSYISLFLISILFTQLNGNLESKFQAGRIYQPNQNNTYAVSIGSSTDGYILIDNCNLQKNSSVTRFQFGSNGKLQIGKIDENGWQLYKELIGQNYALNLNNINTNSYMIMMSTWEPESLNTPYKQGLTIYGSGIAITYHIGNYKFGVQMVMAVGDSHIFIRHCLDGEWSEWVKK